MGIPHPAKKGLWQSSLTTVGYKLSATLLSVHKHVQGVYSSSMWMLLAPQTQFSALRHRQ